MRNYIVAMSGVFAAVMVLFIVSCKVKNGVADKKVTLEDLKHSKVATFAGGCFWCTESDFEKLPGVISAVSGYTGGDELNPTYKQVSSGTTGHIESVRVTYDNDKVTYAELLDYFWEHVDPTDAGGQFIDRGPQYISAIFYHDDEQKSESEASMAALSESKKFADPIVTKILPLKIFYPAEEYHQDYYTKNPIKYKYYRFGSGRDQFLKKHNKP